MDARPGQLVSDFGLSRCPLGRTRIAPRLCPQDLEPELARFPTGFSAGVFHRAHSSIMNSTKLKFKKRVWIDLDNSPHVLFFAPIIEELKNQGIDVTLTARDAYQVRELLSFYDMHCEVIGGHSGKNKGLKVLANCSRALQLLPTAFRVRPDLGLSHGSRAQVMVCKALGIPTTVMDDYEFSIRTGFLEPDWTVMPEVIPDGVMSHRAERVKRYPGLKEDVYVPGFLPDPGIFGELGISGDRLIATLRPPADEAHYHNPESDTLFAEVVRFLGSQPQVLAVTLPRNQRQASRLRVQWAWPAASGQNDHSGAGARWPESVVVFRSGGEWRRNHESRGRRARSSGLQRFPRKGGSRGSVSGSRRPADADRKCGRCQKENPVDALEPAGSAGR